MSDRMLVQRQKAAASTNTNPAIPCPTPPTLAPSANQQPSVKPPQAVPSVPASVQEVQDAARAQEKLDLQAQLERAERFGHNLSRISLERPQAKPTVNQPGDIDSQHHPDIIQRRLIQQVASPQQQTVNQTPHTDRAARHHSVNSSVHSHLGAYPAVIQRKLIIGQVGDQYEQEADRVADRVMNAPTKADSIGRQAQEHEEQESVLLKPLAADITPAIQHQVELEAQATLQRAADGSVETSSNLESRLLGAKGGGSPLPNEVRDFMEPRIGADFSQVRVHTNSSAVQMNRELSAQAFTHGRDIYFGAGKYNPSSSEGKRLLAHELTHVVQQTGGVKLNKELRRQPKSVSAEKSTVSASLGSNPKTAAAIGFGNSPGTTVRIQAKADPSQILEQLKNTPPTSAFVAYGQAQVASTGALEAQKQQVAQSLPKIPAPTGLPARKLAAIGSKEKGTALAGNKETLALGSIKQQSSPAGKVYELNFDTSQISTKLGKAPTVDLTGEADPSQMDSEQRESSNQVRQAKLEAEPEIHRDFGENNIFPAPSHEVLKANKALSSAKAPAGKGGKAPEIPGEVIGSLNHSLGPVLKERIGKEQGKYIIGKHKFERDTAKAKGDADNHIAKLNKETSQKQLQEQKLTKASIAQSRQEWQAELDSTEKHYHRKAGKATQDQKKKIAAEKHKGEQTAAKHIDEAEKKAEQEKQKAQQEENQKKEDTKKQSGSVWDRIKSAASAVIDGLKQAINLIYDNLRKAVKAIFDVAKQLVVAAIELARKAIVGLIKGLGIILKGLVSVVFAAFPNIAKKINSKIDQAIKIAVKVVNAAADLLKKGVSAVLDFLANTLDSLLGLVQSLYNGIFTVIGMIVRGEFAQLLKHIGNLIAAAKTAPSQFETAALEQFLGDHLDQPLSPAELAQAGVTPPGTKGAGTPQMGKTDAIPGPPWSEANIGVDAVEKNMQLSPSVCAELMQHTKGEGEVELGASNDSTRTMNSVMSEVTGQQEGGQEEAKYPDDGLTPRKRAEIRWKLMKNGIAQWWSKNWPKVIAGATVAIGGFIALNAVTGGAIMAALPVIMEVMNAVFVGQMVAQIGGYVRDYLAKGWAGDIKGGGKSLAQGLAAGAIEVVSYLTFKAGEAAFRGAKALVKGGLKLAKRAANAISEGAKFIIEKGKFLFKGFAGSGLGKNLKRLQDLGEALLEKMRFKKFRIRLLNRQFKLEGLINPWVLLAEGRIVEFKKEELPGLSRVGDEIMTPAGRGQIVALGDNLPDAKLTSLIDKRPPRGTKIEENTPRNPAENSTASNHPEEYEKLVEEWRNYQQKLAQRRYQGVKNNLQGTDPGDWDRYQHYMAERGRKAPGEPMTFEEWTKLSREKPSTPTRTPGENIDIEGQWGNLKSKVYGHAAQEHGAGREAYKLQDRARSTNNPQGHWNNDQFIIEAEQLAPLEPGEHIVNMGKPVGNVYLPNGTVLEDVMIVKVIRDKNLTLKTAYPFV